VLGFVTATVTNLHHRQCVSAARPGTCEKTPSRLTSIPPRCRVVAPTNRSLPARGSGPPTCLRTDPTGFGRLGGVDGKDFQPVEEIQSPREFSSPPEVSSDEDLGRRHGRGRESSTQLREAYLSPAC
jgi:hypothetical protein